MKLWLQMLYFVFSENDGCTEYARKASVRTRSAFRPRTAKCYNMLFRSFVAFCLFTKVNLSKVSVSVVLSYLEFLVENEVSVKMVMNHVSAIRGMSILYDLPHEAWRQPKVGYFIKALKLHRPMVLTKRNIIDIKTLKRMVASCHRFPHADVFKAVFLTAFFGFFRLSIRVSGKLYQKLILPLVCHQIFTHFTPSGAQVLHWLMIWTYQSRKSKNMAPGRLNAFRDTFVQLRLQVIKWLEFSSERFIRRLCITYCFYSYMAWGLGNFSILSRKWYIES